MKIDKSIVNYIVNVGLIISFILSFITGIFKMPEWTRIFFPVYKVIPAFYMTKIHDISGIIMGILVLVHIVLYWKLIVKMTKKIFKREK